jgi:hypothetical protein
MLAAACKEYEVFRILGKPDMTLCCIYVKSLIKDMMADADIE